MNKKRSITICVKCDNLYTHGDGKLTCQKSTSFSMMRKNEIEFEDMDVPDECLFKMEHMIFSDEENKK